jgi:phytanoyl-CoA hydroxylase
LIGFIANDKFELAVEKHLNMSKLNTVSFTLQDSLTQEQVDFFDKNGFIVFNNFIDKDSIELFKSEAKRVEKEWIAEGRDKVNGIPIKMGKDDEGNPMVQRFCFLNKFSPVLNELIHTPKLKLLLEFLQPYEGRIGDNEKDGLVLNNYLRTKNSVFSQMGWHTDAPRDIFLGQKIMPMLNVGIHLDDCPMENGGLRLIPGTHKQSTFKLLFGKKYFIDNNADPKEIGFDIAAGTLTVHDGRLWHRVQQSPNFGEASRRRVMYIPFITGKYKPKTANSKTPFYHRFASKVNK